MIGGTLVEITGKITNKGPRNLHTWRSMHLLRSQWPGGSAGACADRRSEAGQASNRVKRAASVCLSTPFPRAGTRLAATGDRASSSRIEITQPQGIESVRSRRCEKPRRFAPDGEFPLIASAKPQSECRTPRPLQ